MSQNIIIENQSENVVDKEQAQKDFQTGKTVQGGYIKSLITDYTNIDHIYFKNDKTLNKEAEENMSNISYGILD